MQLTQRVIKLGGSQLSELAKVNSINRLCDAVSELQKYIEKAEDRIARLESEITALRQSPPSVRA